MKITASILILLIFAMAFAPCNDASETIAPQQVELISNASITAAADLQCESERQEQCSPLCPCQCCPSINSEAIDLSKIASIDSSTLTSEENLSISSVVNFLIWSPPQLLS